MIVAMVVAMVVMMVVQIMVRVMHFVNDGTAGHEQHSFGHGVIEEMEQRCAKGYDNNNMIVILFSVDVSILPIITVG